MKSVALFAVMVFVAVCTAAWVLAASQPGKSAQPGNSTMKTQTPAGPTGGVRYSKSGHDITRLDAKQVEALATTLTEEERRVLLRKGTEPAFCGNLLDNKLDGTYACRLCGLPLFSSEAKFNSGTGWPSFFKPYDPAHVGEVRDESHGMVRTEIVCARCDGHLGHVFEDGPRPTGLRYCLNSASLTFHEKGTAMPEASMPVKTATAYFAGGCFWGVEDRFQQIPGVIDAVSGYMGGRTPNPTYKQVCTEDTGHAETVRVTFDPARVSYQKLLEVFFKIHDASQVNRQGPDIGTQYRSAVFTADGTQQDQATAFIEAQRKTTRYMLRGIATQVVPVSEAGAFYAAEEYHQDYHVKHGGHCAMPDFGEDEADEKK
ncbi:MAG: bifunctional methionine sulfoxide reductase B/A protein [Planctomycetota bacterium]|nr:bifunctional methionine sulfoxide reductase B/A protein [Planctomycetota bacterium]